MANRLLKAVADALLRLNREGATRELLGWIVSAAFLYWLGPWWWCVITGSIALLSLALFAWIVALLYKHK